MEIPPCFALRFLLPFLGECAGLGKGHFGGDPKKGWKNGKNIGSAPRADI
jgi:hypothetical protein